MKIKIVSLIMMILLVLIIPGCGNKSTPTPPVPEPPGPEPEPVPTEQQVATMFYHDTGPTSQFDIFSAELYIVPKADATAQPSGMLRLFAPGGERASVHRGVYKFRDVEINGQFKERVVINAFSSLQSVDLNVYDFEVRNVENITQSNSDDFAVNVNSQNQVTFVTAPDGLAANRGNTEIVYMSLDDRVRHQLTPINGQYSGDNWDPDWKTDDVIVWSHNLQIVEVNINALDVSDPITPGWNGPQYDPKYSPDGTMLLFNSRANRQKNSHIQYLATNNFATVLPTAYFNLYPDDNPTWVFSNSLIAGHIFMNNKGRIYHRDIVSDSFLIITDGTRDFRYVSPIQLEGDVFFIFSDWTDQSNIALWVSNQNGTYLRELNQTGDEAVFRALGLPTPSSEEDLKDIARRYVEQFDIF